MRRLALPMCPGKASQLKKEYTWRASADPEIFIPMISEAKKYADIVVVQSHWGQEYDNDPNDRQRQLARAMSDAELTSSSAITRTS